MPSGWTDVTPQPTPSLGERFAENVRGGFGGTLAGAGVNYFRDPATVAAERQQYENMPSWMDEPTLGGKLLAGGTALAGSMVGSLASPESWIPAGRGYQAVRKGAPLLWEMGKDALIQGGVMGAANVGAQTINIAGGNQQQFDPTSVEAQALMGATFGMLGPLAGKGVNLVRGPIRTPELPAARTPLQIMEQDGVDALEAGQRARAEGWQPPAMETPAAPAEPTPRVSEPAPEPAPPQPEPAPPAAPTTPEPAPAPEPVRTEPSPEPPPPSEPPVTPEPAAKEPPPDERPGAAGPEQPQRVPGVGAEDTQAVQPPAVEGAARSEGGVAGGEEPAQRGAVPGPEPVRPPSDEAVSGARPGEPQPQAAPAAEAARVEPAPAETPGRDVPASPEPKPAEPQPAEPRPTEPVAAEPAPVTPREGPITTASGKRPVSAEEQAGLLSTLQKARAAAVRNKDPARQAELDARVKTAQDAYTGAEGPPPKPTGVIGGQGPEIGASHAADLEAHAQLVNQRVHAEGSAPVPDTKTGLTTLMGGREASIVHGQDSQGQTWLGTGHALVRADTPGADRAAANAEKRATTTMRGVSPQAIDSVTSGQGHGNAITWERTVTDPGTGIAHVIGRTADGERVVLRKDIYDSLHTAAGKDGTLSTLDGAKGSKGNTIDQRVVARNAQGEVVGAGMPRRMLAGDAHTLATGEKPPALAPAAAKTPRPRSKVGGAVMPERNLEFAKRAGPPVVMTPEGRAVRAAQFDEGTSPYRQVFRDAGLNPDDAVQLPIQRQAEIVKHQVQATYGLKSVTSDLSHIDTRDRLSTFYQNAQAMAHVNGMPPDGISLNGRLSLHLARDTGKGYLGAYHPGKRSIELVSGANSFAHEWMHAADHYLSEALLNNPKARALLSETQALRSATFQSGTPAEAFAKVVALLYGKHAPDVTDVLKLQFLTRHSDPAIALKAARELTDRETNFARNAREFGEEHGGANLAQYYYRPAEMIARAFEAFQADRAERAGLDTAGISKPDRAYADTGRNAINDAFSRLYPKEEERAHLFEAFSQLMDRLREHDTLAPAGLDLAKRPPEGDIVDASKWHILNPEAKPAEINSWRQDLRTWLPEKMGERLGFDPTRPAPTETKFQRGKKALNAVFGSINGNLRSIANSQENPEAKRLIHALADTVFPAENIRTAKEAAGRRFGPVFEEAVRKSEYQNTNRMAVVLKNNGYESMTKDEKLQLYRYLQGDPAPVPAPMRKAGGAIRYLLDSERSRLTKLGIEIGYSKNGYVPHVYDTVKILQSKASRDAFEADARIAYGHAHDADPSIGGGVTRAEYAAEAAADWRRRLWHEQDSMDKQGFSSRFTKGRTLPPEADAVMEKWRLTDPTQLIPNYFRATARRAAFVERYGLNGEYLDKLWEQLDRAGVSQDDSAAIKTFFKGATGQHTGSGEYPSPMLRAINMIHAVGTMALMPRALFTSLGEPMAMLARTGSLPRAMESFANQIGDVLRTASSEQRKQLADTIGITTNPLYDSIVSSRMGPMYDDAPAWGKTLTSYFQRTGLTALTNSQRRSTMASGHTALTAWAHDFLGTDAKARHEAAAQFRDLGVADADHAKLANWIANQKGALPDSSVFTGTRPPPEGAALWSDAITRLVDQVIQNPLRTSSPLTASNPVGRLVWGLMRFNYAFYHNIVENTVQRYEQRIHEAEGVGGKLAASARMAGGLGLAGGGILGASLASTMVREAIFNPDKWQEMNDKGQLMDWLTGLAIQRTGVNGPLDPVVQAITSLRYEGSFTGLTAGAQLSFFLNAAENMFAPFTRGAPYSNVADFDALKGAYNMFAVPAETIGLTALPGGPLTGKLFGAGMMLATSRFGSEKFAASLAGPKGSTAPKPEEAGKLPGLAGTGQPALPGLPPPGATGPQQDAGVGGLPIGMLDDLAAPAVKYGAPVVQKLPGPLKALGLGAAAVAGGSALASHLSRYTIPPSSPRTP